MSDNGSDGNGLAQRKASIARILQESRVVDFDRLGSAVTKLGPELEAGLAANDFGSEVATDYVVWGVSSVIHAYHNLEATQGLEAIQNIVKMQKSVG